MSQDSKELILAAVPWARAGRNMGAGASTGPLAGARTARHVRRVGFIPGILYGHGVPPSPLAVRARDVERLLPRVSSSTLLTLDLRDGQRRRVLVQEVQRDPLSGEPVHMDFHQVKLTEKIRARVPLRSVNVAPAVKEGGGVLIQSLGELEVEALPEDLPSEITFDLAKLQSFDDRITVADLPVPANVQLHAQPTDVVAVVTPPRSEEEMKELETTVEEKVAEVKTEAEEKKTVEETKKAEEEKAEGGKQKAEGKKE